MPWQDVDYDALIPNNVALKDDPKLQRALEKWHPGYIDWWMSMGPVGFQMADVYLRTAISVEKEGWARFGYVKMPDYRWGILLAPTENDRRIPCGAHVGEPAWQEVPGEYRSMLRRLIVIQGDTEPASVEQQKHLGATAPSLYDLRNLFQVNVEEGRHLWAMVYLLHKYFGRDGREEADDLLRRSSGSEEQPRMLGAFNEETPDWLSFFMFTYFTDRDGKMQLEALARSGFDPLSRTCRFMLAEEAHHMFVGYTGVKRIVEATSRAMATGELEDPYDTDAIRRLGVIDLPAIQRKVNLHYSVTLDLFGSEESTNAANFFNAGLKARYHEERIDDDHQLRDSSYPVVKLVNGALEGVPVPALNALNARLRDDFMDDCLAGIGRWNKEIASHGIDFEITLPHVAFNRAIGEFADLSVTPDGEVVSMDEFEDSRDKWLPMGGDQSYIESIMQPHFEPGEFASWIAPPTKGIDQKPTDFEYVKLP